MTNPCLADHAIGLELRIEESVSQRQWAEREGWTAMAQTLEGEIADLYAELADTAEQAAGVHYAQVVIHHAETASHLVGRQPS